MRHQRGGNGGALCVGNQRQRSVLVEQREVAVQPDLAPPDRAADIGQGGQMRPGRYPLQRRIVSHKGLNPAVRRPPRDRAGRDRRGPDGPAISGLRQRQVDNTQMRPHCPGHHRGCSGNRPAAPVGFRPIREGGRGEDKVAVAKDHDVDSGDARCRDGGIFHAILHLGPADACVAKCDDHVGTRLAQGRYQATRRCDDILGDKAAVEEVTVPAHDLRRHKADDPDSERLRPTRAVRQAAVEQDIRWQERAALPGRIGDAPDIGQNEGEGRRADGLFQKRQAEVEVVVAQRGRIVAKRVHGGDHGMEAVRADLARLCQRVGLWTALEQIAVVKQQRARHLGPCGADQAGGAHQPHGI